MQVLGTKLLFSCPSGNRNAEIYEIVDDTGLIRVGALWDGTAGAKSAVPVRHLHECAQKDPEGFGGMTLPETKVDHDQLLISAGLIKVERLGSVH